VDGKGLQGGASLHVALSGFALDLAVEIDKRGRDNS
jgi:hypothetical protein